MKGAENAQVASRFVFSVPVSLVAKVPKKSYGSPFPRVQLSGIKYIRILWTRHHRPPENFASSQTDTPTSVVLSDSVNLNYSKYLLNVGSRSISPLASGLFYFSQCS